MLSVLKHVGACSRALRGVTGCIPNWCLKSSLFFKLLMFTCPPHLHNVREARGAEIPHLGSQEPRCGNCLQGAEVPHIDCVTLKSRSTKKRYLMHAQLVSKVHPVFIAFVDMPTALTQRARDRRAPKSRTLVPRNQAAGIANKELRCHTTIASHLRIASPKKRYVMHAQLFSPTLVFSTFEREGRREEEGQ